MRFDCLSNLTNIVSQNQLVLLLGDENHQLKEEKKRLEEDKGKLEEENKQLKEEHSQMPSSKVTNLCFSGV